jgi:hypothetical protein
MRAQVSWSGIRYPIVETLLTLGSTTPMTVSYLCCMPYHIDFLAVAVGLQIEHGVGVRVNPNSARLAFVNHP